MSSRSVAPPLSTRMGVPRKVLYAACALLGTGLILVGAQLFRIDHVRCTDWPPLSTGYPYALAYVAALTLLTIGWLGLSELGAAPADPLTPKAARAADSVAGRQAVSLSFILLVGIACNVLDRKSVV